MQIMLRTTNVTGDSVELLVECIQPNLPSVYRTYKFKDGSALTTTAIANFMQAIAATANQLSSRADAIAALLGQDVVAYVTGVPDPNIKGILTNVHKDIDSVTLNVSIQPLNQPAFVKSIICMTADDISVDTLNKLVVAEADRIKQLLTNVNNISSLINTDLLLLPGG